jgi:mRNA interferase HigB
VKLLNRKLIDEFIGKHPEYRPALERWMSVAEAASWKTFIDIKKSCNSADYVKGFVVFDIQGNHLRLIAVVTFREGTLYITHLFTHKEYDTWSLRLSKKKGKQV